MFNIEIEKWKKTTKSGKIIKLEGEWVVSYGTHTAIYDYETKTLSVTFTPYSPTGKNTHLMEKIALTLKYNFYTLLKRARLRLRPLFFI